MRWLITGGAGFIGTNVALRISEENEHVSLLDDFSRPGSEFNRKILMQKRSLGVDVVDISDQKSLWDYLETRGPFDVILNLAGQVSMINSIQNPVRDFEVNTIGVMNLLEFIRKFSPETLLINTASNKIYGDLEQLRIVEHASRYTCPDWPNGFDESLSLDFKTPYGCSKGAADQYLADFAAMYNLRTVSLRQSSVYGPHQHPRSDQGWVSFFLREALTSRIIRLNGNGKQVRDLLHVNDLAQLILMLPPRIEPGVRYQFNVGGGLNNSLSILELFSLLSSEFSIDTRFQFGEFRKSDQKVFISSNTKLTKLTNWRPETSLKIGLEKMILSDTK